MKKKKKAKKVEPKPMLEKELSVENQPVRAQIVYRKMERCEKCDAINSFRQKGGMRYKKAFDQAYAFCNKCGHRVHLRRLHVT